MLNPCKVFKISGLLWGEGRRRGEPMELSTLMVQNVRTGAELFSKLSFAEGAYATPCPPATFGQAGNVVSSTLSLMYMHWGSVLGRNPDHCYRLRATHSLAAGRGILWPLYSTRLGTVLLSTNVGRGSLLDRMAAIGGRRACPLRGRVAEGNPSAHRVFDAFGSDLVRDTFVGSCWS